MSLPAAPTDESVDARLGQIADEFTQRLNRGERPSVEEYASRHPEIAELLRQVLPVLQLIRPPGVEAAVADADLAAPLGDFRRIREIGRGGMGVVYEAQQLSLNRPVALKILPFAAALDPRLLQRFKTEAETAGKLQHEHIVQVYHVGCERGVHFYAMQYIDGLSLAAVIHELRRIAGLEAAPAGAAAPPVAALTSEGSIRSPAFFCNVARVGAEAADALAQAHKIGVLHRDVKPANLLVDARGSLWVTDFGLALVPGDTRLTITGDLVGTLRYMSPEQAWGERVPLDERTDIYSLGATLYELLTLEPAFGGRHGEELLRQIAFDDPRPPCRLNRRIPRDLETIVSKAMAKAPDRRYGSATELAEDLRRFLSGQSIKGKPVGVLGRLKRVLLRHLATALLGLVATIAVVALVLTALVPPPRAPSTEEEEAKQRREALARIYRDLDEGKTVTLIGKSGAPAYFRWRTDEALGKATKASDGAFSVQHVEYALVELLPDPHLEHYRIRARVRHDHVSRSEGRVGIYFGHSEHAAGGAHFHWYCNVAFSDLTSVGGRPAGGQPARSAVRLEAHHKPQEGLGKDSAAFHNMARNFIPALPVGAPGPWREIAVEVHPDKIKVSWEGKSIGTLSRADLLKGVKSQFIGLGAPVHTDALFAPRQGLGLFVNQGVASFQSVTVGPPDGEN